MDRGVWVLQSTGSPRVRHDFSNQTSTTTRRSSGTAQTNRLIGASFATKAGLSRRLRGLPLRVSLREGTSPRESAARAAAPADGPQAEVSCGDRSLNLPDSQQVWGLHSAGTGAGMLPAVDHPRL